MYMLPSWCLTSLMCSGVDSSGGSIKPDTAAAVSVPPSLKAAPRSTTKRAPTQRDLHLQVIQERGRPSWQTAVNYRQCGPWAKLG